MAGPIVEGVSAAGFTVEWRVFRALILTPERVLDWAPPALTDLAASDLASALELPRRPEFVLLGTGERLAFPPKSFTEALAAQGIGLEPMDSRAAARTWNVLRAEDRWICAAILPG